MRIEIWCFLLVFPILAAASKDTSQLGDTADDLHSDPTCRGAARTPSKFEPLTFKDTKWIWTGENAQPFAANPLGTRGFRKYLRTPRGKCATCAEILIGADNSQRLWVNGKLVGESFGFKTGQIYFTALNPSSNSFAIAGNNVGGPAAVFATIRMHYSDGTSDIIVTDDSWKTLQRTPPGSFSRKSFNDRSWTPAYVQGGWDQIGSTWGQPTLPPVLPLENSRWIWTSDNDLTSAPVGSRGFRRTVSNRKKRAVCATALIAADNLYTLYVNGRVVGSGTDWTIADAWYIPNLDPVTNTFAVNATNVGAQAGLIAIIIITYTDGSNAMIATDASWKSVKSIPSDFAERLFHDRHWENASVIGNYGASPWNQLTLPLA